MDLCISTDTPFITNLHNIEKLFQDYPEDHHIELLETINSLLDDFEYNPMLLRLNTDGLMFLLVFAVKSVKEKYFPTFNSLIYCIIQKLLMVWPADISHYDFMYQTLSDTASQCQSRKDVQDNYKIFEVCANILFSFIKAHSLKKENTMPYFYFAPFNSKIEIQFPKDTPRPFSNVRRLIIIGILLYSLYED